MPLAQRPLRQFYLDKLVTISLRHRHRRITLRANHRPIIGLRQPQPAARRRPQPHHHTQLAHRLLWPLGRPAQRRHQNQITVQQLHLKWA